MDQGVLQFILKMRDEASQILSKFGATLGQTGGAAGTAATGFGRVSTAITGVATAATGAVASIVALNGSLNDFRDFQMRMLEVGYATNQSGDQLEAFNARILKLSLDMTVPIEQLQRMAAVAGRAGVDLGAGMDEFMLRVGNIAELTDVTADKAAQSLVRLARATSTPISQVAGLADSFVALRTKTEATGSELLQTTEILGRSLGSFGVSAKNILAFSTAMGDMGGRAQMSAMAVTQVFSTMRAATEKVGPQLGMIARAMGVTAEQARRLIKENPEEAFFKFAEGLGAAQRSGQSLNEFLGRLGLSQRMITQGIFPLTANMSKMKALMDLSADSARAKAEADQQMANKSTTVKESFEQLTNATTALAVVTGQGLAPAAQAIIKWLTDMTRAAVEFRGSLTPLQLQIVSIGTVATPVILGLAFAFVKLAPAIWAAVTALTALGVRAVAALFPMIAGLTAAMIVIEKMEPGTIREMEKVMESLGNTMLKVFTIGDNGIDRMQNFATGIAKLKAAMGGPAAPAGDPNAGKPAPNLGVSAKDTDALRFQVEEAKKLIALRSQLAASGQDYGRTLAIEEAAIKQMTQDREKHGAVIAENVRLARELAAAQYDLQQSTTSMAGGLRSFFEEYSKQARDFGTATKTFMTSTFQGLENQIADFVVKGKADWRSFIQSVISEALKLAAIRPLLNSVLGGIGIGGGSFGGGSAGNLLSVGSWAGSGFGGSGAPLASAKGNAFSNGVVNVPTLFKFAKGAALGVMGEAGPEAVMPLKRGPNGELGVMASGGGSSKPMQMTYAPSFVVNGSGGLRSQGDPSNSSDMGADFLKAAENRMRGVWVAMVEEASRPGGMLDRTYARRA